MKLLDLSICRARHPGTFADRFSEIWFSGMDGDRVRIVSLRTTGMRIQSFFG